MITRSITVIVSDEASSSNQKIILYKGDGNITFNFDIQDGRYKYSNQSILEAMGTPLRANATMVSPNGENVFQTPVLPVQENNIVPIMVTKEMIDELDEVGTYRFQIHLYSETQDRITLPPLDFEVSDTIGDAPMPNFDDGIVGFTRVGESYVAQGKTINIKYVKNVWSIGDLITDVKLNNMENGIENNALNIEANTQEIEGIKTSIESLKGNDTTILEAIGTNGQAILKVDQKAKELEKQIGAQGSSIGTLETELNEAKETIGNHTSTLETHGTDIQGLKDKNGEQDSAIGTLTTDLDNAELQIDTNKRTILETKKEVEDARVGTKGERYDTLKERLDGEYEKIRQQIVDPYLDFKGERVTVENSLEGHTRDIVIEGRTHQNLKELSDPVGANGTLTSNGDIYRITAIEGGSTAYLNFTFNGANLLKANTTYTLITKNYKAEGASSTNVVIYDRTMTKSIATFRKINDNVYTVTLDVAVDSSHLIQILFYCGTSGYAEVSNQLMILEGDWTNKEIPSYFEGIQSVGDKTGVPAGKNLLNINQIGTIDISNGQESPVTNRCRTSFIPVKTGEQYVLTCPEGTYRNTVLYDINKVFIKASGDIYNNITQDGYMRLIFSNSDTNTNVDLVNFKEGYQLELNTVPTPYEPYYEGRKISILSNTSNCANMMGEFTPEINKVSISDKYTCHIPERTDFTFSLFKDDKILRAGGTLQLNFYDIDGIFVDFWSCTSGVRYVSQGFDRDIYYISIQGTANNTFSQTINGVKVVLGNDTANINKEKWIPYKQDKKEILLREHGTISYHPKLEMGTIDGTTGTLQNANNRVRTGLIKHEYIKTLTCSFNSEQQISVGFYDKDGVYINASGWKTDKNIILPSNCVYIRGLFAKLDHSACSISDFDNVLISQDSLVPNTTGLKSLPNGTCDTIEQREDGVYFVQRVGKKIIDGTEIMAISNGSPAYMVLSVLDMKPKQASLICDKLPVRIDGTADMIGNGDNRKLVVGVMTCGNDYELRLRTGDLSSTVESSMNWLKQNPVTIYYELATPIETKLDISSLNLETFKDVTHVQAETLISPIFNFKTPIDTLATISSLMTLKNGLIEENNSLKQQLKNTNEELNQLTTERDLFILDIDERLLNLEMGVR